jgi:hypothetical protein
MPADPRQSKAVTALVERLKPLECDALISELRRINDEDTLGWARYHFMGPNDMTKPWQLIVINRYLERDRFFRNILPQWLGTAFGLLSLVVAILALVVAMRG